MRAKLGILIFMVLTFSFTCVSSSIAQLTPLDTRNMGLPAPPSNSANLSKHSDGGQSALMYKKSKEEIAWDLMIYGIQTIPTLKSRIKNYDDLLTAYRMALHTVTGQDQ